MLESTTNVGVERNRLSIFLIALDGSIAQTKCEGRIGGLSESALSEPGLGDDRALAAHHRIDLILELFSDGAGRRINGTHGHDQGIDAGVDRSLSALVELLTHGNIVELRIRDEFLRRIRWSSSLQHLLDVSIVFAESLLHLGQ